MRGSLVTIAIGVVSACVGIALVALAVRLADDVYAEQQSVVVEPAVRPTFALDAPAYVSALPDSVRRRIPNDPAVALARVAHHFGIPRSVLAAWVEADASSDAGDGTAALAPTSTDVLDAINRPMDEPTWAVLESLTALLGYDPRPLDSHTCRGLVLGTAVRGAFLATQHDAYAAHLSAIGLAPSENTLWYFALLSVWRGDREVMACIEEITALGEDRRRALEGVATARAAMTDRLVLRAFLKEWQESEARLRRDAFLEATADVLGAIRTG